ncbi:MAG: hypothetical protein GKR87_15355 [Kiritimatiellae bacterium]|nr:hypothetical protein [Kiritimatiellia bacterium]
MNTGILPALAQQVMKNRQILSDGFRPLITSLTLLYKCCIGIHAFKKDVRE